MSEREGRKDREKGTETERDRERENVINNKKGKRCTSRLPCLCF